MKNLFPSDDSFFIIRPGSVQGLRRRCLRRLPHSPISGRSTGEKWSDSSTDDPTPQIIVQPAGALGSEATSANGVQTETPMCPKKATPVATGVASLAPQTGFEPVASSSAGKRSNPLSYWGMWRGGRDLNPRGSYSPPTHLAGGRTRPGYATSPLMTYADSDLPAAGFLAEGEGFEPPVTLPPQRFSRPPPSSTRPSLRGSTARARFSLQADGQYSREGTKCQNRLPHARFAAPA